MPEKERGLRVTALLGHRILLAQYNKDNLSALDMLDQYKRDKRYHRRRDGMTEYRCADLSWCADLTQAINSHAGNIPLWADDTLLIKRTFLRKRGNIYNSIATPRGEFAQARAVHLRRARVWSYTPPEGMLWTPEQVAAHVKEHGWIPETGRPPNETGADRGAAQVNEIRKEIIAIREEIQKLWTAIDAAETRAVQIQSTMLTREAWRTRLAPAIRELIKGK